MADIDTLKVLLENDDNGIEIAKLINSIIIDEDKKLIFIAYLSRIKNEINKLNNDVEKLTNIEQIVENKIIDSGESWTTIELSKELQTLDPALKHRSNISTIVASLGKKGYVGRYKEGHAYYYTNPKDAVKRALILNGWDESLADIVELAEYTGMPITVIYNILDSLN